MRHVDGATTTDAPTPQRIHLFGASGSGTTTLGEELARRLGVLHLDTDRFYWKPTEPPFLESHPAEERIRAIDTEIGDRSSWVLSGSLCSWGDPLIERFTLAIFLQLDPVVRLERLRLRERERYGVRIDRSGEMYEQHREFMAWAESYDHALAPVRSRDLHERWMKQLSCPVMRLNSKLDCRTLADRVLDAL